MGRFYEDIRLLGGTVSIGSLTTIDPNNIMEITGNSAIIGTLSTINLKVSNGAQNGYILQSDASGNATWVASSTGSANFANTNLTFTNNRTHNLGGYDLVIGEGSSQTLSMFNGSLTQITYGNSIWEISSTYQSFDVAGTSSLQLLATEAVFNNGGRDYNFRVEGDTQPNLFFVDASTDNIGMGNNTPAYRLQVTGTVSTTGFRMTNGASSGYILQSDASGNATWVAPSAGGGGVTGSGTTNYIPRWTSSDTLSGTSSIYNDGNHVGIGTTSLGGGSPKTLELRGIPYGSAFSGPIRIMTTDGTTLLDSSNLETDVNSPNAGVLGIGAWQSNTKFYISNNLGGSSNYNMRLINTTTVTNNKTGLDIVVTGNGLSNTNYGISTNISGANSVNYGNSINISGTYSTVTYGNYTSISTTGQSTIYGNYVFVNTNTNTSRVYGVFSQVFGGSSNMNVGVWGIVGNSFATTSADIGGRFIVSSSANLSSSFGITVNNTSSATIIKVGVDVSVSGGTSTLLYGSRYLISADSPTNYGIYNQIFGTGGSIYAYYNQIGGQFSNNSVYGSYNSISNSNNSFGVYNQITGATFGNSKYGVYTNIQGTGSCYGEYITITATGPNNYGLQISVSGANTNNYSIQTLSGDVIFNDNGQDWDFRVEGDTNPNLFFVDASADNVGIGTNAPNSSAMLDITSTTKGFLPPRMNTTQREAMTPVAGLIIFNTTTSKHEGYDGATWSAFY